MDKAKQTTLQFLEYYGLLRLQRRSPVQALQPVFEPEEQALATFSALAQLGNLKNQMTQAQVAGSMEAVGSILGMVPVIGTVAQMLVGGMGYIIGKILAGRAITCTKGCRSPSDYDRRTLVGINPPPYNRYYEYETLMPTYIHDGLVVSGTGARGTADQGGRSIGVQSRFKSGRLPGLPCTMGTLGCKDWKASTSGPNWTMDSEGGLPGRYAGEKHRYNWWMRKAWFSPEIAEGNFSEPWKDKGNNYYYRAWRVQKMLGWLRDKTTCGHLVCMSSQLMDTKRALFDIAVKMRADGAPPLTYEEARHNPMREKGSRWFASMYFLHKDLWDSLNRMPKDQAVEQIMSVGDTPFAAAYKLHREGQQWPDSAKPWDFFGVTSNMRFEKGIKLLQKLKAPIAPTRALAPGASYLRRMGRVEKYQAPPPEQEESSSLLLPVLGAAGVGLGAVWLLTRKG